MNENIQNDGLGENLEADALLSRMAAADPAAGFDASTLSSTLVDDAVASAASKPNPNFARRQGSRLGDKLAQAYRDRPRFVLGSAVSGLASVAAIAIVGSIALHGATGTSSISPLFSLSAAGGNESVQSSNKVAADGLVVPGANDMMMPMSMFHYNAADTLSDETGSAHVYQIVALEDSKAVFEKLAQALGVEGTVHKGQYSTLTTVADETKPLDQVPGKSSLTLQDKNWWLSAWYGEDKVAMTCSSELAATNKDSCFYVPSDAEAGISKADAIAQFIRIMQITGASFKASEVQFNRDRYSSNVWAELSLNQDGASINTGLYFGMQFDSNGNVFGASGALAKIVDKGTFSTISPIDAVARANDPKWSTFWGIGSRDAYSTMPGTTVEGGSSEPSAGGEIAVDPKVIDKVVPNSVLVEPTPVSGASTDSVTSGQATTEPMPAVSESPAAVKVEEVTIVRVLPIWLQASDSTGNTWLVPGYQLLSDENNYAQVPSVQDGLIAF